MTDAPTAAQPSTPQPDQPAAQTRSGRLLTFVRKLIDFGNNLLTTVQAPETRVLVTRRYGIQDVNAILVRLLRGLFRAEKLQERIIKSARSLDRARAQTAERSGQDQPPQAPRLEPERRRLPTAEQIARRTRQTSIGAVIAEICRDFEIISGDPLWLQLVGAVAAHRGPTMRLIRTMRDRVQRTGYYVPDPPKSPPVMAIGPRPAVSTGPP